MAVTDRDGVLAGKGASLLSAVSVPTCEACIRRHLSKALSGAHTADNKLDSLVAAAQSAADEPRTFTIDTPNTLRSRVTVSCHCGCELAKFYTDLTAPVELRYDETAAGADAEAFTKLRGRSGGVGRFAQRVRHMLSSSRICVEEFFRILGMCGAGSFDSRRMLSQSSEVSAAALQRIVGERGVSRLLRSTTDTFAPRIVPWGEFPSIELGSLGPLFRDILNGDWDALSKENQQLVDITGVKENFERHSLSSLKLTHDQKTGSWLIRATAPFRLSIIAGYVAAVDGSWGAGKESNIGQVGTILIPPDRLTAATSYALTKEFGEPYEPPADHAVGGSVAGGTHSGGAVANEDSGAVRAAAGGSGGAAVGADRGASGRSTNAAAGGAAGGSGGAAVSTAAGSAAGAESGLAAGGAGATQAAAAGAASAPQPNAAETLTLPAVPDYLRPVENTQFSNGRVVGAAQHPLIFAPVYQLRGEGQNATCSNKEIEPLGFMAGNLLAGLLGRMVRVQIGDNDCGLKITAQNHGVPASCVPVQRLDTNHGCKGITKFNIVDGGLKKALGCAFHLVCFCVA